MSGQHPSCRGLSRTTVKPLEQRARLRPARHAMNNMEARSSLSRVLPARRHLVKQARLDEAAGGGPLGRRAATLPEFEQGKLRQPRGFPRLKLPAVEVVTGD